MYYRMHEIESEPERNDEVYEADVEYDAIGDGDGHFPMLMSTKSRSSETSLSSNNKQKNDDSHKIRKYFPETWLWKSNITGYAMQ
jgi:hypothetical protein